MTLVWGSHVHLAYCDGLTLTDSWQSSQAAVKLKLITAQT